MWRLSEIEHQINWNLPTVLAMIKILSIKPDITESGSAIALNPTTPVKIEFCDVGYMYPSRNSENIAVEEEDKPDKEESHTLKKVSFTINKGDKVALLGPSGSGKSTLARLCYRAMDPTRGSILFDGRDLRDIKLSSLMQSIEYYSLLWYVPDGLHKRREFDVSQVSPIKPDRSTSWIHCPVAESCKCRLA
jgi:ABC-type multidrug transport system fused ATPase/permease subunit